MEEIMATAKLETRPGQPAEPIQKGNIHLCSSSLQLKEEAKLHYNVPKMGSKLLMISVFVLDLIAFGLAVAAELKRNTAQIQTDTEYCFNYCAYDSDIATGFGVGAFLFLMATQLLVMVATHCFSCGRALIPGPSRASALLLFIICWVSFLIASACLLAGSVRNSQHTTYRVAFLFAEDIIPLSCETLRKGVFAGGAAFIVFTAIISELYYVYYSKASRLLQDNTVQLLT